MNLNDKSRAVSLTLTILFGPLGLLYSSIAGALILLIAAILTASSIAGPIVCWILAIAIGDHCTYKHNQSIAKLSGMMSNNRQN